MTESLTFPKSVAGQMIIPIKCVIKNIIYDKENRKYPLTCNHSLLVRPFVSMSYEPLHLTCSNRTQKCPHKFTSGKKSPCGLHHSLLPPLTFIYAQLYRQEYVCIYPCD